MTVYFDLCCYAKRYGNICSLLFLSPSVSACCDFVTEFQEFDTNGDGWISVKEFRRALDSMKIYNE